MRPDTQAHRTGALRQAPTLWASLPLNIVIAFTRLAEMQPKTKNIAQLKKALDRVSRCRLLDAGDLVTVEASGPGYFPDAPLASCLAHRCANLLERHWAVPLVLSTKACR